MLWFFLSLLFLLIAAWIFIHTPFGQNWIAKKVTNRFSRELKTKVSIQHVDLSLFNRMHLKGVMIEDRNHDTLLYAGDLQLRITDWFFLKKKIELKYIGLEDAVFKFQRSDSIWSQQFLFDYFSSPSTGTKKKNPIDLNLKKVYLKNVTFLKKDAWFGEDMTVHMSELELDGKEINFTNKIINANSLNIVEPIVSLYKYDGNKPRRIKTIAENTSPIADTLSQWNPDGWAMNIDKMKIVNGNFLNNQQTDEPALSGFDGKHIDFNNIYGEFSNVRWNRDSITAHLDLKTKERSGLEVKSMQTDAKFFPTGMEFSNLDIQTNNSVIKNFFSMSYADIDDMDDFLSKVKMTGNFEGSEINSDDIAFFAPALSSWKKEISLNGNVRGTVEELIGKNMIVKAGKNTLLNGDISLTGLPDIEQTFIDFKANDFRTVYSDAVTIVPDLRRVVYPDLKKIKYVHFQGSFTGFIRDFVTFGNIETNLGTVKSDLNMKLPRRQEPIYSGSISTENFQLGEFFDDPNTGAISMSGTVKGRGLSEKTRNAEFDGKINFIDYYNYRYTNLAINGRLDKKLFDGIASINDPNVELSMNGKIDFNEATPVFDLYADVKKADLQKLNITRDTVAFHGKFKLDFKGDNLDNFIGNARITDASLVKDGQRLPFDTLILSSDISNGIKTLTVNSNEFDGNITGNFSIKDLPDAFSLFLNKYYPSYIKAPVIAPAKEAFTFDISTRNITEYMNLLNTDLKGFDYSHVSGRVDLSNNRIDLDAEIPNFSYNQYVFTDAQVKGTGTLSHLLLSGKAGNTIINDTLNLPLTVFKIDAANDSSQVNITTQSNSAVNKASINAMVQVFNNGVNIRFDSSYFVINGKTWNIEKNGQLQFGKNIFSKGSLALHEGEQSIMLNTEPSQKGNWNDLNVEFKKLNIGDLSPLLLPKNRLEGIVSGKILVEDPYKKFNLTGDVQAEKLLLDNDSLGNVIAHVDYQNETGELKFNGKNLDTEHGIDIIADLFLKDKEKAKNNRITAQTVNYPIKIIERFVGTLFSDIQGYATGPIEMTGPLDELNFTGKLKLHEGGLKVKFTQCFYTIEDTYIDLKPTLLNLDGITLIDPVTKNPIYLNGNIQHHSFKDMFFDINVSTRKPATLGAENNRPILLLNTTYNDNQQFYGRVKGTGSFILQGPESEMFMGISAIASDKDTSNITIPPYKSRESGIADFLIEKKYGHEMIASGYKINETNIIYDVDVTANPMLNVKVVLDELTGDEIKGHGEGTLNIHSGTSEPLTMRGRLNIQDGNYLFTFQSFFKKPFEIRKGSDNFIEWNDDPYKAIIHLDAVYKADKVSFSTLAQATGDETLNRYRDDVYIVATLSGELFKPQFNFRLEFPPNSKASSDPAIAFNIRKIENNPNEINRQVAFLIVFNSFAPLESSNTTGNFGSAINEFAYSTITSISGLFFNEINKALNKALSKILKTENLSLNFSGSLYNRNLLDQQGSKSFNINQGNFNINMPISFFKDRFIVTLGGTFDVPLQSTIQQNVAYLPDVTAEWLINQSGTVRATFFYRQNLDYLSTTSTGAGRTKRQGASINYRKDFDTLGELLRGKKKKQPKTEPIPQTENSEKPKE